MFTQMSWRCPTSGWVHHVVKLAERRTANACVVRLLEFNWILPDVFSRVLNKIHLGLSAPVMDENDEAGHFATKKARHCRPTWANGEETVLQLSQTRLLGHHRSGRHRASPPRTLAPCHARAGGSLRLATVRERRLPISQSEGGEHLQRARLIPKGEALRTTILKLPQVARNHGHPIRSRIQEAPYFTRLALPPLAHWGWSLRREPRKLLGAFAGIIPSRCMQESCGVCCQKR